MILMKSYFICHLLVIYLLLQNGSAQFRSYSDLTNYGISLTHSHPSAIEYTKNLGKSLKKVDIDEFIEDISVKTFKKVKLDGTCFLDAQKIFAAIKSQQQWGLDYLDAMGKPDGGIQNGEILWYGDYDFCTGPLHENKSYPVNGHYCSLYAPIMGAVPGTLLSSLFLTAGACIPNSCGEADAVELANLIIQTVANSYNISQLSKIVVKTALCHQPWGSLTYTSKAIAAISVFSVLLFIIIFCTFVDLFLSWRKRRLAVLSNGEDSCFIDIFLCSKPRHHDARQMDQSIHFITDSMPILPQSSNSNLSNGGRVSPSSYLPENSINDGSPAVVVVKKRSNILIDLVYAFSLIRNTTKLMNLGPAPAPPAPVEKKDHQNLLEGGGAQAKKTPSEGEGTLTCLHGFRFLSLTWVILGHVYVFAAGYTNNLLVFIQRIVGEFTFQGLFSGTLSVDSFFMLSGLLTSYVFLREIKRVKTARKINWVLFYFHRVWRLSPPYFFFLFIYSTTYRYLWDGPAFPQANGVEGFCPSNWWTNLLYVNNLVKRDQPCMGWSWYLANDMQFYIISPIFLLSLHYFPILGVIITSLGCLASIITTGLISAHYDLKIGTFGMTGDGFTNMYVVPWCRISPYLLGLLAGFILVKTRCQLRLHWAYQLALWAAATGICLSVVYGPYGANKGTVVPSTEIAALYNATFRFAWTLGIGWMIVACCCGMGGWINTLLSWRLLIPLSRLSYCAYLVHPVVIYFLYQTQFTAMKTTHAFMVTMYCAALCFSYAGAYVLSMMAEAPFLGLEKILIRKH